jgi:hypothetical protein
MLIDVVSSLGHRSSKQNKEHVMAERIGTIIGYTTVAAIYLLMAWTAFYGIR